MVLRGAEARPLIRSRATGADPRALWNGKPRATQRGGAFPRRPHDRRKHPSPRASRRQPPRPAPPSPASLPLFSKPNRWARWLLAGAALSAAAALVIFGVNEDIGARRRTRAEPRPSTPSSRKRRTRPRPRTGAWRRDRERYRRRRAARATTRRRTPATRGRCDCLPAHPGIASTWTAAAPRSTNPEPSVCPAAGTSSRSEARGRRSRSMSVAEVSFSYNRATLDEWRRGPTAEAIRHRARARAHAIAADGSEP